MRDGQRTYTARAVSFDMGTAKTGTEQIVVEFQLIGGDEDGKRLTDFFPLSEKAIQYTFEKLAAAGWDGQDMVSWNGLGSVECRLVVEDEEHEGKLRTKIIFVNRVGVAMKNAMDAAAKNDFASRMRGHLAAFQQEKGIRPSAAPRGNPPARGGATPRPQNAGLAGRGGFDAGPDAPYNDDDAPPYR